MKYPQPRSDAGFRFVPLFHHRCLRHCGPITYYFQEGYFGPSVAGLPHQGDHAVKNGDLCSIQDVNGDVIHFIAVRSAGGGSFFMHRVQIMPVPDEEEDLPIAA